ncbi:hypothetical protein [Aureispira anguillae]|uniref:Uncharacterized protein n=1 Tax=Aureispira anguillae TaxID=2864201 RepID=A0A915YL25_9BACT|nr:hypothetical protein [Aureispira anguillae]BDS14917.1 hypothetical protein AsAng_0056990 [Aureispira anguillae]
MKSRRLFFNVLGHGAVNPTLAIVKELTGRGRSATDEIQQFIQKNQGLNV